MRKIHIVLILATMFSSGVSLAAVGEDGSSSKACATIADACTAAGFVRTETPDKRFWQDCMRPVILGQTVQGVTVDADTVKTCRTDKIDELKKELDEFQKAS